MYIFELGSSYDCSQVRVEPANKLLYDLKNEVIMEPESPRPQEQKLGFFKTILNALFGAYEDERLQLKEQFLEEMREYNYRTNGIQCEIHEWKADECDSPRSGSRTILYSRYT